MITDEGDPLKISDDSQINIQLYFLSNISEQNKESKCGVFNFGQYMYCSAYIELFTEPKAHRGSV